MGDVLLTRASLLVRSAIRPTAMRGGSSWRCTAA